MGESTRRGFLIMTGAGAAAVGVAAAVPAASRGGTTAAGRTPATEPLVAYVGDPGDGTVSIMVGEREVVVRDRDLVARLAHAAS